MQLEQRIEESLEKTSAAWWQWDVRENRVTFHEAKVTMLGYRLEDFRGKGYEAFTDLIHPDDYPRSMAAMRAFLSGKAPIYRIDYRIKRSDGSYTWYVDRGLAVERSDDGAPSIMRGFVFDLGKELEKDALDERVVALIRQAFPEPVGDTDRQERVTVVCAGCKKLKIDAAEWIGIADVLQSVYPERLSHGICPDCLNTLYPEFAEKAG